MAARLEKCWWCGFHLPAHDPRCDVPARLEALARRSAPAPLPPRGPSSLELFQEAQAAGATIGHQWVNDVKPDIQAAE